MKRKTAGCNHIQQTLALAAGAAEQTNPPCSCCPLRRCASRNRSSCGDADAWKTARRGPRPRIQDARAGNPDRCGRRWRQRISPSALANGTAAESAGCALLSCPRVLENLGYSLRANRKTREGSDHPDQDAQFEHINAQVQRASQRFQWIRRRRKIGRRFQECERGIAVRSAECASLSRPRVAGAEGERQRESDDL
jgi:hypothetical protein